MQSVATAMAAAAIEFRDALTPGQRSRAALPFKGAERMNWHYVPRARRGLSLKEMTIPQRDLARALLRSGLSDAGLARAEAVMSLEVVLRALEHGGVVRDPDLYFVTIFGEPGLARPWGWRVEGHHLSVNVTVAPDEAVSVTPSFFGSNPARVLSGPRQGLRVLAGEEDRGRALITALDSMQRSVAVIAAVAPPEIITGAERKIARSSPAGLAAHRLTPAQRPLLMGLIEEYAHRFREDLADRELAAIERAGVDAIHFAWAGGLGPGAGHYYRVQGPTFLIEYDNTQNNANHVHAVWREFDGDFGEDLLRAHYAEAPHR